MANIALALPNNVKGERCFANVNPKTQAFETADSVVTMAVAPNDRMWVVLQNGGIEVRNVHSGHLIDTFPAAKYPSRATYVWCATCVVLPSKQAGAAAPGVAQMWLGLASGTIEVYNADNFQLVSQLRKHISGVFCLANNQNKYVFSGSSDFHIAHWRARDGQLLRVLSGHSNYVRCLFSERSALVSGSDDGTIKVWDVDSGKLLYTTSLHKNALETQSDSQVNVNNNNNLSAKENKNSQQRRLSRSGCLLSSSDNVTKNVEINGGCRVNGVSTLCRVGMTMWSGDDTGTLAIWKLQDGSPLLVSRPHTLRITSIQKVGSRVYTSSADGTICVHNALDGSLVHTIRDHAGSRVMDIKCAVEVNRYYVWTGAADNTVRCWHHDEHSTMTAEREAFNDMRWYYAFQRPYVAANQKLLSEKKELSELCMLTIGSTEAVQDLLDDTDEEQQTSAMQFYVLENKLKELQNSTSSAEEKRNDLAKSVEEKRRLLESVRQNYQNLSNQIQQARLQQQQQYLYGHNYTGGVYNSSTTGGWPPIGTSATSYNTSPPQVTSGTFSTEQTNQLPPFSGSPIPLPSTETNTTVVPSSLPPMPPPPPPSSSSPMAGGASPSAGVGSTYSPALPSVPPPPPGPVTTTVSASSFEPDFSKLPPPPPAPAAKKPLMPLSAVIFGVSQKVKSTSSEPDKEKEKPIERRSSFTLGTAPKPLGGRRLSF